MSRTTTTISWLLVTSTLVGCSTIFTSEQGADTEAVGATSTTNELISSAISLDDDADGSSGNEPGLSTDLDREAVVPVDGSAIAALLDELEAGELVVWTGDDIVAIDNQGPEPVFHRWRSDYSFSHVGHDNQPDHTTLFGHLSDSSGRTTSIAAFTIDGTEVCRATEGWIEQVTRRADGTWVMALTYWLDPNTRAAGGRGPVDAAGLPLANADPAGPYWNPTEAVDCQTGETTNILPRRGQTGEAESTSRLFIRGRRFVVEGDAEGNGPIVAEDGTELSAGDYAGYFVFSTDGSQLLYTDHSQTAGPHHSNRIVSRDSTTGDEQWRIDLSSVVDRMFLDDDRVYVELTPDDLVGSGVGWAGSDVAVIDAATGAIVTTAAKPPGVEILHIERLGETDG